MPNEPKSALLHLKDRVEKLAQRNLLTVVRNARKCNILIRDTSHASGITRDGLNADAVLRVLDLGAFEGHGINCIVGSSSDGA
jgi:methionine synthase I (cobalamin-dependent)